LPSCRLGPRRLVDTSVASGKRAKAVPRTVRTPRESMILIGRPCSPYTLSWPYLYKYLFTECTPASRVRGSLMSSGVFWLPGTPTGAAYNTDLKSPHPFNVERTSNAGVGGNLSRLFRRRPSAHGKLTRVILDPQCPETKAPSRFKVVLRGPSKKKKKETRSICQDPHAEQSQKSGSQGLGCMRASEREIMTQRRRGEQIRKNAYL